MYIAMQPIASLEAGLASYHIASILLLLAMACGDESSFDLCIVIQCSSESCKAAKQPNNLQLSIVVRTCIPLVSLWAHFGLSVVQAFPKQHGYTYIIVLHARTCTCSATMAACIPEKQYSYLTINSKYMQSTP